MIELQDIRKKFGAQEVLRGVSLKVPTGSTRVILGLSGSGKSVLMKHIIGLLRPDSGKILIENEDITKMDNQDLLRVRAKFGMVFQQAALFDPMSVGDNVAFPLREHTKLSKQEIEQKVLEKLDLVGLKNVYKKFPSELSGGMRKRVGLARAIVLDPKYVLYDEPTTGLDPLTTDNVDNMILEAKEHLKVTSVVISHDVGSAFKVADDIAVINEGVIVADCPKDDLRHSKDPFVQKYLQTWFGKQ